MKNNILAIILARSGSKRLKNKNIKKLKNKALVNWTTSIAIRSNKFCNIIVSSDSNKILKTVELYDSKILTLKRPKRFSDDKSTSEIAILHAVKWYEKNFFKIDYIALLQPTSPFRTIKTIKKGVKEISNTKLNAVIAVKKVSSKSSKQGPFYTINNSFCREVQSANSLKKIYKINGLFYLIKKNFFIKKNDFSPSYFKPIIINSKKENIDIDTIDDWNLAKKYI